MRFGMIFEDRVRRVAEAVWRLEPGGCQPEWYRGDPVLHELDGIARLPDITHLLMATVDTKLQKVKEDVDKLLAAVKIERKRGVPTKQWLITEKQLNAEHVNHCRSHGVEILTLEQFRDRSFNGRDYLSKRRTAAFGSARNLRDNTVTIPEDEYVDVPMTRGGALGTSQSSATKVEDVTLDWLTDSLLSGEAFVLVGPFGAGKSLTARQVFMHLSERFTSGREEIVPLAINLREHWGALYADEILERHARSLGFSPREGLTVAWRSGLTCLILDGFDEVATQTIARANDRNVMRQVRFEALQAVRDMVRNAPQGTGILLCGRDHYFDTPEEMVHALGLSGRAPRVVRVGEFTEGQAATFLKKHGAPEQLPDWLPRKPLFLAYLAHQHLLETILKIDGSRGFGYAWDSFLDIVCKREAELDRAVMDPATIRRVLERLSCFARATPQGNGAISSVDLAEAYTKETGDTPGEGVLMQLQRLPGLTPREQDPAARSFVDEDLLQALQGAAVARAIAEPKHDLTDRKWNSPLRTNGLSMAAYRLEKARHTSAGVFEIALRITRESGSRLNLYQLAADCLLVAIALNSQFDKLVGRDEVFAEAVIDELDLEEQHVDRITLKACYLSQLVVGPAIAAESPLFEDCIVDRVTGVPSRDGLPPRKFINCEFGAFDDASTNAAILKLDVSPGLKALLTILRKLYMQAGGGRQLAALRRGLPGGGEVHKRIEPALKLLEREGMVTIVGNVAHPVRRHASRVHKILAGGDLSADALVHDARDLK